MSFVFPILFASIAVITFIVAAAFFPISITWFYQIKDKKVRRSKPKRNPASDFTLAPSTRSYREMHIEDDYDDKEL